MLNFDLTSIPLPSDQFHVIICNHVLEHIPRDRKALSELFRVLKSGGWAVLQVSISRTLNHTHEDPTINTRPAEKPVLKRF